MGRELLILREAAEGGQSEPLRFVMFTPDGERIIAHTNSTVYEWNAAGYAAETSKSQKVKKSKQDSPPSAADVGAGGSL